MLTEALLGAVAEAASGYLLDYTLAVVKRALAELLRKGVDPSGRQLVAKTIVASALGVRHELKIILPIIPLLPGHKEGLMLGSRLNLEAACRLLVARVRGGR